MAVDGFIKRKGMQPLKRKRIMRESSSLRFNRKIDEYPKADQQIGMIYADDFTMSSSVVTSDPIPANSLTGLREGRFVTPSVLISAADSSPILTEEQRAYWQKFGYLSFDRITSQSDVENIRTMIQGLFETKAGFNEGAQYNLVGKEGDPNSPSISQIVGPRHYASNLRKTPFFRNAFELARQILGDQARFVSDHTLCKPAKIGPATPWHQDEAFRNPEFDYNEISIWMPLQAVNEVNGCMEFLPGSNHSEILPHRSFLNDETNHGLECFEGFDPKASVICPLPAGGCTVHSNRTLHSAGPNLSDGPRYAYVLIFGYPPVTAKTTRRFPWLEGKKTGRGDRMRQWMRRGGLFVALWRFVRESNIRDFSAVFAKLRMQCTTFFALWRKRK